MFLIYGEDAFLIKMQKNKILKKINPDNEYYLQEYNYLEDHLLSILNDANTIPMFSEKRIIMVNDSYFLTEEKIKTKIDNKSYLTSLMEYLTAPNPSTFIIFICPVNKLSNRLKITKQMLALTSVLKATNLSYNELIKFIDDYITKHNGTIKQNLISKIVEYLPNNLYIIKNELEKLLLINSNITMELIENNMTKYLDTDIFKLVDDLLKNDLNSFLINYHYLQERGLNSIALLALITNSIIFTRDIIVLSALKKTPSQIAEILQIHPFRVKKISEHMHNFSINKANNIIQELFWIDYNIKKGIIRKEISSDLYLIKLFDIN
ncbi:DNA polymerase III subunit delta [Spiroplasma endosymbiont of Megaselia nigra]|uniref:DNA polymerase III subunit delta n=1 Tax=Spiroplasma endosymbiont of Megaselia nigra TaxID=2478537 RepID=UPI000F86DB04|nr:DNA polymerase III subunit delta [Spiroplasma endosymbiont of Megaselia nigra]RUO86244.1 DNA polymerase III subunit delta [Spiroplasma endosymbiont of Megaselia nigra]